MNLPISSAAGFSGKNEQNSDLKQPNQGLAKEEKVADLMKHPNESGQLDEMIGEKVL